MDTQDQECMKGALYQKKRTHEHIKTEVFVFCVYFLGCSPPGFMDTQDQLQTQQGFWSPKRVYWHPFPNRLYGQRRAPRHGLLIPNIVYGIPRIAQQGILFIPLNAPTPYGDLLPVVGGIMGGAFSGMGGGRTQGPARSGYGWSGARTNFCPPFFLQIGVFLTFVLIFQQFFCWTKSDVCSKKKPFSLNVFPKRGHFQGGH